MSILTKSITLDSTGKGHLIISTGRILSLRLFFTTTSTTALSFGFSDDESTWVSFDISTKPLVPTEILRYDALSDISHVWFSGLAGYTFSIVADVVETKVRGQVV